MRTYAVLDPSDRQNPLDAQLVSRSLIHHGTRSLFSSSIEEHGLSRAPFRAKYGAAIHTVVSACKTLHVLRDGYPAAQLWTDQDRVYLTSEYTRARAYSQNVGSEALFGAIRAAEGFLKCADDSESIDQKACDWETALRHHGGRDAATQSVIANLRNPELIRRLSVDVQAAQRVLNTALRPSHPVVYAVQADDGTTLDESRDRHEYMAGIVLDSVPVELIVARVDFSNGIDPDSE
jgi:hypothetical protein